MASLKKLLAEKTVSQEDLSYLSMLLDAGLTISECFDLLRSRKNETVFTEIRKKLDDGMLIESIISGYLPASIRAYVVSLLPSLSFSSCLSLSLQFQRRSEEGKKTLLSSLAYPLILLFVAMTCLYLFDLYGMDTIFSMIASFDADLELYRDMRVLFSIVVNLFYYGILLIFGLIIFFSSRKRIVYLYIFVSRYFPNSFFNIYYSEEFMSLLLVCARRGYSTKEALDILKAMRSKPIVSFLAYHMDESLLKGETLKEAARLSYYDSSLSRFIKIANYSNDFSDVIDSYIDLAKQKIVKRMKSYSLCIQLFTYAFIACIIIFIYQILFMPMQAISGF